MYMVSDTKWLVAIEERSLHSEPGRPLRGRGNAARLSGRDDSVGGRIKTKLPAASATGSRRQFDR